MAIMNVVVVVVVKVATTEDYQPGIPAGTV